MLPLGELLPRLDLWKVDIPEMKNTNLYAVHALVNIKHSQKKDHNTSALERSLFPLAGHALVHIKNAQKLITVQALRKEHFCLKMHQK